jgi:hypothetical protein
MAAMAGAPDTIDVPDRVGGCAVGRMGVGARGALVDTIMRCQGERCGDGVVGTTHPRRSRMAPVAIRPNVGCVVSGTPYDRCCLVEGACDELSNITTNLPSMC